MSNSIQTKQEIDEACLAKYVEYANREHGRVLRSMRNVLKHARQAGFQLLCCKKLCPHGTWTTWLQKNFVASEETARAYMRLAKHWKRLKLSLPAQKTAFHKLTLAEALELIRVPRAVEPRKQWNDMSDKERDQVQAKAARRKIVSAFEKRIQNWDDDQVVYFAEFGDLSIGFKRVRSVVRECWNNRTQDRLEEIGLASPQKKQRAAKVRKKSKEPKAQDDQPHPERSPRTLIYKKGHRVFTPHPNGGGKYCRM